MEATVLADTTNTIEEVAKSKLAGAETETQKRNVIHVSNTKKPFYFYLNLAKKYIKQHDEIQLSALGMAIPNVVIIAEILKSNGLAIEKKVLTSLVCPEDDSGSRLIKKAKIVIVLERKEKEKVSVDNLADENAATEPKKDADDN